MTTNQPTTTIRDGSLKATVWPRSGENGTFHSVEFSRTYTDDQGRYQDAHSFSGSELLRLARLAHLAYDAIASLRAQEGGKGGAQ